MSIIEKKYNEVVYGRGVVGVASAKMKVYYYLLDDLLIDTGPNALAKKSIQFFKKHPISNVALTHAHEDHCGLASWFKDVLDVPVYLNVDDHHSVIDDTRLPLYRKIYWKDHRGFLPDIMPEQLSTENFTLDVIKSPGHTPGHVIFHEKNRGWLFTGDMYLGVKQNVAFKDENMSDVINSLKMMYSLDFDTIFCSHAGVIKNGREQLSNKIEFLESLQERVNFLKQKGMDLKFITKDVFPGRDLWKIFSRGEWSSYNIIKTI